jgi:hypothetical protein
VSKDKSKIVAPGTSASIGAGSAVDRTLCIACRKRWRTRAVPATDTRW